MKKMIKKSWKAPT